MKLKLLFKNYSFLLGLGIITIFLFMGIFSNILAPYDPLQIDLTNKLALPSWTHLFGTDNLGRDIFSRIIFGSKITLFSSIFIAFVSLVIGIFLGIISGYSKGIVDTVISRLIDMILAFPALVIALYLMAMLGAGIYNLIFAIAIVGWVKYARLIRALTISERSKSYVKAAIISGSSHRKIIFKHILINTISPIILLASIDIGNIILAMSALSFLGLGVMPPTPEWGVMLNEGRIYIETSPHLLIFPVISIFILVMAFNLIGRSIQKIIDGDA